MIKRRHDIWNEPFMAGPIASDKFAIDADQCSGSRIILDKDGARVLAADLIAFADSEETENEGWNQKP